MRGLGQEVWILDLLLQEDRSVRHDLVPGSAVRAVAGLSAGPDGVREAAKSKGEIRAARERMRGFQPAFCMK
jgi:hypothetical protein